MYHLKHNNKLFTQSFSEYLDVGHNLQLGEQHFHTILG